MSLQQIVDRFNNDKNLELELRLRYVNPIIYHSIIDNHIFDKKSKEINQTDCIQFTNQKYNIRSTKIGSKTVTIKKENIYTIFDKNVKITLNSEIPYQGKPVKDCDLERVKRRITKTSKYYKGWNFDFTVIQQTGRKNRSEGREGQERYEFEVEYDSDKDISVVDIENIVKLLDRINYIGKLQTLFGKKIGSILDIANQPKDLTFKTYDKIYQNYAVTEKADGLRAFILIDSFNNIYRVSKPFNIHHIGVSKKGEKGGDVEGITLLDCEFLEKGKGKYLVFDILVENGKKVTGSIFSERMKMMKDVVNKLGNKSIVLKGIEHGDDMCKLSKKVYGKKYGYGIDGLIFIPMLENYYGDIFKWKPEKDLTIDFIVREVGKVKGGIKYNLYVRINKRELEKLKLPYPDHKLFEFIPYNSKFLPVLFKPWENTVISNADVKKHKIKDNIIVELWYDKKGIDGQRWKVYRVREDKTLEYHENMAMKTFYAGPNAWRTAKNIMDLIMKPITSDMIFCKEKVPYFVDTVSSNRKVKNLFVYKFHRFVISQLYQKYIHPGNSVMELAAGKGADLCKVIRREADYLFFTDVDADALKEAERRYVEARKTKCGNGSLKRVTEVDFERYDLLDPKSFGLMKKRLGKKRFNVIIMNFAIHYFMENDKTFGRIVDIVDHFLNKKGFFIFSGMDGNTVFNKITEQGNTVQLKKNDVTFVKINKLYKGGGNKNVNGKNVNGKKVKVFVEKIGLSHDEYLINFSKIISIFEKRGYRLRESEMFISQLDNWDMGERMSKNERVFSGLNRYIVLEKI